MHHPQADVRQQPPAQSVHAGNYACIVCCAVCVLCAFDVCMCRIVTPDVHMLPQSHPFLQYSRILQLHVFACALSCNLFLHSSISMNLNVMVHSFIKINSCVT